MLRNTHGCIVSNLASKVPLYYAVLWIRGYKSPAFPHKGPLLLFREEKSQQEPQDYCLSVIQD